MNSITQLKKHWFLASLLLLTALTMADTSHTIARGGKWLGELGGVKFCIFMMFLLSGLGLESSYVRKGISDFQTIITSLFLIFLVSPLLALLHTLLPLDEGLRTGLILIAIMPTTLSSGVVMTGLAGGNTATASMVTIIANWVGIFSIPMSLELLVGAGNGLSGAVFDKTQLAMRLGVLVLLPLLLGMVLRKLPFKGSPITAKRNLISQLLVLTVIWVAVSRSTEILQQAPVSAVNSALLALSFHASLFLLAMATAKTTGLKTGSREVVWFMGSQKTLPIALLIQTTLFPHLGNALIYCVVHHILHLGMDSYIAGVVKERRKVATP